METILYIYQPLEKVEIEITVDRIWSLKNQWNVNNICTQN